MVQSSLTLQLSFLLVVPLWVETLCHQMVVLVVWTLIPQLVLALDINKAGSATHGTWAHWKGIVNILHRGTNLGGWIECSRRWGYLSAVGGMFVLGQEGECVLLVIPSWVIAVTVTIFFSTVFLATVSLQVCKERSIWWGENVHIIGTSTPCSSTVAPKHQSNTVQAYLMDSKMNAVCYTFFTQGSDCFAAGIKQILCTFRGATGFLLRMYFLSILCILVERQFYIFVAVVVG